MRQKNTVISYGEPGIVPHVDPALDVIWHAKENLAGNEPCVDSIESIAFGRAKKAMLVDTRGFIWVIKSDGKICTPRVVA